MNIKMLTFKNLQTIIAEVVNENLNGTITISRPLFIGSQQTPEGSALALAPFLEWAESWENGLEFSKDDFMIINDPKNEVGEKYRQLFSSIELASSMPNLRRK